MRYDKIIIGAGLYGLYSAYYCAKNNEKILVLEYDQKPMSRATYVNQARIHNGYHYPRSYSTAIKSANYFNRFNEDYAFAVNKQFKKIYATSAEYSWTNAEEFRRFCDYSNIKCEEIYQEKYFKYGMCDGVFETQEYSYDARKIRDYYVEKLNEYSNVEIKYNARIKNIVKKSYTYEIELHDNSKFESEFVLNATYASTNQINDMLEFELFKIKYEICEIILCKTTEDISDVGITIMDGPFFSVMPFGLTGYHSLTSVTFTPHMTSYDKLPIFECQSENVGCSPAQLGNCNNCLNRPNSAWNYMYALSKKYLKEDTDLFYDHSLFSMKPILMSTEIDDSRPTVIKQFSSDPTFISVLSGKINTIYDLDEVLSWRTVEV
jgi:hypothetical protein